MSFLSNDKLRDILPDCIEPCNLLHLENSSYELSVAGEYFATSFEEGIKKTVQPGEQIIIEPGQFALLITKEVVKVPNYLLAFISIKATVKFRGLVNVSGFHVDPGFNGRLKFSVYNAGSNSIVLDEGQRLFPIWFCELTAHLKKEAMYNGVHQNQKLITSEDVMRIKGEVLSPSVLNEKIKELENVKIKELEKNIQEINVRRTIYITILTTILALVITKFSSEWFYSSVQQKQTELENKLNTLSENNNLSNSINLIQQNQTDIEKRISSLESNSNKIEITK